MGSMAVCKNMFVRTLGKRTDGFLTAFFRAASKRSGAEVFADHRGGDTRRRPWIESEVKAQIDSYHPQISHYTREHAPHRRYFEATLSVRKLFTDYLSSHPLAKISYETYRQIFKRQRITFGTPAADLFDLCNWGERHLKERHGPNMPACVDCGKLGLHQRFVVTGRAEYAHDKAADIPSSTAIFAVDMQKILLLPVMRGKEYFFVSRLVCFNETFASIRNANDICVLWHEAIAGRNGANVASAFAQVILTLSGGIQDFVFWADNCAPQNKNWTLYSTFLQLVNSEDGPTSIIIKYLEPGHTFMKADSLHGCIGRKLREEPVLYDMADLASLVRKSKAGVSVHLMSSSEFFPFINVRSTSRGLPKLRGIKAVKFVKGRGTFYYKLCHDTPNYFSREFLATNQIPPLPSSTNSMRGINESKKREILDKLAKRMPSEKQAFWANLPVAEVADLCASLHCMIL